MFQLWLIRLALFSLHPSHTICADISSDISAQFHVEAMYMHKVDGKERGLDTMHLYITSRHILSPVITQTVSLVLGTECITYTRAAFICTTKNV